MNDKESDKETAGDLLDTYNMIYIILFFGTQQNITIVYDASNVGNFVQFLKNNQLFVSLTF